MHQVIASIKSSKESGILLQRPYTCRCTFCEEDNNENCINKQYTGGNFKENRLPIKVTNEKNGCDNDDDDDDGDSDMIVNEFLDVDEEQNITVKREILQLENVKVGDFAVVAVPKEKDNNYAQWVYKITKVVDEENIYGYAYKASHDSDIFYKTNEKEADFDLNEILMILPEPIESRARYIFPGHIDLKDNFSFNPEIFDV